MAKVADPRQIEFAYIETITEVKPNVFREYHDEEGNLVKEYWHEVMVVYELRDSGKLLIDMPEARRTKTHRIMLGATPDQAQDIFQTIHKGSAVDTKTWRERVRADKLEYSGYDIGPTVR